MKTTAKFNSLFPKLFREFEAMVIKAEIVPWVTRLEDLEVADFEIVAEFVNQKLVSTALAVQPRVNPYLLKFGLTKIRKRKYDSDEVSGWADQFISAWTLRRMAMTYADLDHRTFAKRSLSILACALGWDGVIGWLKRIPVASDN